MATTPEDISLRIEDITKILKSKYAPKNIENISYESKAVDEKVGLLGEHELLKTKASFIKELGGIELKEDSFFVKYFPKYEPAAFARGTGAFDKEIFVYDLFKKFQDEKIELINECTSKCYYTKKDEVLVFDNLIQEGYEPLDKNNYLGYDEIVTVLQYLAKLHASSLIYEEKMSEKTGKPYRLIDDYVSNFEESFYNDRDDFINKSGIDAAIRCIMTEIDIFNGPIKLKFGDDFKETARRVSYQIYNVVKPSNKFRNVVCHGDLWCTNFLLKYHRMKPIYCKFVDFQCGRYLPPSHDVMSVLHLTTSRTFRKEHLDALLQIYYNELEKNMKLYGYELSSIISLDDFLSSCNEQRLFAIVQEVTHFQLIFIDSDWLKVVFQNKEFYEETFTRDRSVLLLSYIDKNENYKSRLEESIKDLRDYCESISGNI